MALKPKAQYAIVLTIRRKAPPEGEKIEYVGLGSGDVLSAVQSDDGFWRIEARFWTNDPVEATYRMDKRFLSRTVH